MIVYKKVNEIFNFIDCRGKSPDKRESGIPLLTAKNIKKGFISVEPKEFLSEGQYFEWIGRGIPSTGDLLFTTEAPMGNVAVLPKYEKVVVAQRVICLSPNIPCDTIFYKWLMLDFNFQNELNKKATGSTVKGIRSKELAKIQLPYPPFEQQKKIADILDAADALRQNDKALILKYEELTQALFLDMFGDPLSNPKGWEKVELKKCTSKIGSGSTPRGGKETYLTEGISLIRSLNIYDNEFKYKNLAFISQGQADKLKNVIVESEDVLFNITGASVCRCSIVPENVLPARVNQHVSILRPKKDKLSSTFLSHLLISENVKIKLLGVGSFGGAVMEAITKEQLEKFEIIVPPIESQNQFAERVALIEEQKAIAQASLIKSEELFHSLLQKAFKGELI